MGGSRGFSPSLVSTSPPADLKYTSQPGKPTLLGAGVSACMPTDSSGVAKGVDRGLPPPTSVTNANLYSKINEIYTRYIFRVFHAH